MSNASDLPRRFLDLHVPGEPLLIPNPWDIGSARILRQLGFKALATTSGGFAASLGRADGAVTRDEAIAHAAAIQACTGLPVNGDFENCFADDPDGVAETVRLAIESGVAGGSIEDWSGAEAYPLDRAAERVRAAAEAAHAGGGAGFVLTARADNHFRKTGDVADTIARLQAYQAAGADVLYAPGLTTIGEYNTVLAEIDRPLNALALPGGPGVAELAQAGVARISIGSLFAMEAYAALIDAAKELRDSGSTARAADAIATYRPVAREAFAS